MNDQGKHSLAHSQCDDNSPANSMVADHPDANLSDAQRAEIDRKLLRKLDFKLIPWLCVLYLLAFLDRTNIGNAKVAGLGKDLALSGIEFNQTLTIFFISYALAEPITNVMLKRFRPSIFIPVIVIAWGLCMTFMGFVTNWSGLMAARWFLGLAEAGLFPGINYYLSCWYRKSELGIRAAIFFSAAALSGSFGGLLAAAIEQMAGLGGLHGWAWIFILEGLITVLAGAVSFWLVYDFPAEASFLGPDDRIRVIARLKNDQQHTVAHESWDRTYIWISLRDWKMWLGMIIYMGCDMPLYAFSLFLPSIVNDLGWNTTPVRSQLMSVPPYAIAALLTVLIGYIADRTRQRGLINMGMATLGIVGFMLLIVSDQPSIQYGGTFLGAAGIYPCIANTITWVSNNTEGSYKRGFVLGMVIGWGNLNGVVSSNIYFQPMRYFAGHGVVIGYMALALFGGSWLMRQLLKRENAARRHGKRDYRLGQATDEKAFARLGDQRPDFVYTL